MSAILVVRASTVTTAPGGADGYFTVADNSAFQYPGAIVAVTKSDGSLPRQCIIIDLSGTTKVGLQFFDGTRSPRYNKDSLTAYDTGSALIMEAQVVSTSDDKVGQLVAGANISLSPPSGLGTVTITGKDDPTIGYDTVQYPPGTALTQRTKLSFATADFTVADNAGSTRTDVSLKATGPGAGTIGTAGITSVTLDAQGRVTAATAASLVTQATQVIAGTGLSGGGALSASVTLSLPNTGPGAGAIGTAGITSITLDAQGRVTAATAASLALQATTVTAGTGLSGGGDLSTNRTISMPNTGPGAGTIGTAVLKSVTLDAQGRVTAAAAATGGVDYQVPLTFGSGVTRTSNAISNDLITGLSGGQTIIGDTAASGSLTLKGTSNGTPGTVIVDSASNFLVGTATNVASSAVRVLASKTLASGASAVWNGIDAMASTLTLSGSTNITTSTGVNFLAVAGPTITSGSALTITHAATMYVGAAPTAAGSTTITNAWSMRVDGKAVFGGAAYETPVVTTAPIQLYVAGNAFIIARNSSSHVEMSLGATTNGYVGTQTNNALDICTNNSGRINIAATGNITISAGLDLIWAAGTGKLDLSGITAGSPNLKVTATSDTPATTYAAHVASTDPAGFIEILVGAATRYIPFFT